MRKLWLVVTLAALALEGLGAEPRAAAPFENGKSFAARNTVDRAVSAELRRLRIKPAGICSDAVFIRRVHLDLIGTLPDPQDVTRFLRDRSSEKRSKLIETLFVREEFADYWALKWCDLLRVKAEFPINLWPNGVQAYHRWVRDAMRDNMPLDDFARALLTSSGSNFRVAPANFYRAVQNRTPEGLAQAAALTFMGARVEAWPPEQRERLAAFFSRVAYKPTREWKEEIIYNAPAEGPRRAVFPDGTEVVIGPDQDPRVVFADWLLSPSNLRFPKNAVNRIWAWLLGRGIVHEPDDFREDNPPSNPTLLTLLAKELVLSDFDLRHVLRLILNSATYQQSPVPRSNHRRAESLFAHYIVRQLDAEVLTDALCRITGSTVEYMSAIPEPFTFIPQEQRSIALADGSISSPFLEMFGRPARDTGLVSERNDRPTAGQRLHMLNSRDVQNRITNSPRMRGLIRISRGKPDEVINGLYLTILSRPPTAEEQDRAKKYMQAGGLRIQLAAGDLAWALLNTKEFLYRH